MLSDQLRNLRRRFTLAHGGPLTISAGQVDLVVDNLDRAIEEAEALEAQEVGARLRLVPGLPVEASAKGGGANGFANVVALRPRAGFRGSPYAPSTPHSPDMAYSPQGTPRPDPETPPCA